VRNVIFSPASAGKINGTSKRLLRALNHATARSATPTRNPKQRRLASLVPNKFVKMRTVVGKRTGNEVNFKLWRTSAKVGSRASSKESHSSRQSPPAWVARTKKTNDTAADKRIATIHSAYLMSFGFTFAVGASIQMIAANFVVEKIGLHGCE